MFQMQVCVFRALKYALQSFHFCKIACLRIFMGAETLNCKNLTNEKFF